MNDLKFIQQSELNILKEFIRICENHKFKYFLAEGTLLGAIRHSGMIPWDDDIDVALFRSDYERFLSVVDGELGSDYQCLSYRKQKNVKDYLTKLIDKRHFVKTAYKSKEERINIWIDIFVIDGIPKNNLLRIFHKYRLLYRKMLLMYSDLEHFVIKRFTRPLYEKMLIRLGKIIKAENLFSTGRQLVKMDNCMKSCSVASTNNTISFMSEYKFKTEFPLHYYGDGRIVAFEDFKARIPDYAEKMLESIYGEYNQLPPVEDRYKHKLTLMKDKVTGAR
jgi:lipopolysaccharide cholinephosphotransferase